MQRFIDWLRSEEEGLALAYLMLAVIGATVLWVIFVVKTTLFLGYDLFTTPTRGALASMTPTDYFIDFILVTREEGCFRFLPLAFAMHRFGLSIRTVLVAIGCSLAFGLLHGTPHNMYLRGVFGLFLCVLFFRAGGASGKYAKATLVVVIVHYVTNLTILSLPEIRL